MAIPTNMAGSYTFLGVSVREDLLDFITNIDPVETPLFSMAPKVPATSTKHEWLEDSYSAATTTPGLEGGDFAGSAITTPTRHANPCQIIRREFSISGTAQAVDSVQGHLTPGYQTAKHLAELARDTEITLIQSTLYTTVTYGDSDDERQLQGLDAWADGTGGNSTAYDTNGTAAVRETDFNDLLQAIWNQGVRADTVLASPAFKRGISDFSTTTRIHHDGGPSSPNAISRNIEMYESDFGTVDIFLERYVPSGAEGYAYKRDMVRVAILRPTMVKPIAPTGDADKYMALHELTLEVLSPGAVGTWDSA